MYNNRRVLIGNWQEEQNGNFLLQKDGNKYSTYQNDFKECIMPVRDNRLVMNIKERALGLPIELFREHGAHNVYNKNMCSLYDLNCMFAYNQSAKRHYKLRAKKWAPEQCFMVNYGPGRNEMAKKKHYAWNNDNRTFKPNTEYRCNYTIR